MSSCLNINIRRATALPNIECTTKDGIIAHVEISRPKIVVQCGVVCSINTDFYLRVSHENIWLIPENGFSQDVIIYSNVDWYVE